MRFESEKEESADNPEPDVVDDSHPFVRSLSSYVSRRTSQRVEVVPRFLLSTDRQRGTRSYEVAVTGNQQPPQQPP